LSGTNFWNIICIGKPASGSRVVDQAGICIAVIQKMTKRLLKRQDRDHGAVMPAKIRRQPKSGTSSGSRYCAGDSRYDEAPGVCEIAYGETGGRRIETLLTDIVARLDRIDENVYPPESAIKPEFIRKIKKARADIRKGKGKTYESMDAFIRAISE
jgi:hypothetical protein